MVPVCTVLAVPFRFKPELKRLSPVPEVSVFLNLSTLRVTADA